MRDSIVTSDNTPDGRVGRQTVRGPDGLMPAQRGWLDMLSECNGDWNEACAQRKVKRNRVTEWMRSDPAFRAAYDAQWSTASDVARRRIEGLTDSAVDTMEELMAITKKHRADVNCPECGHGFKTTVEIKDPVIAKQIAEMILRVAGTLKDTTRHEVTGEIITLSLAEKIALAQLKAGGRDTVSAPLLAALIEKGRATPEGEVKQLESGNVVEGESRRLS